MQGVGFEPTPPKRIVPETTALDHSAILASIKMEKCTFALGRNKGTPNFRTRRPQSGLPVLSVGNYCTVTLYFVVSGTCEVGGSDIWGIFHGQRIADNERSE